MAGELLAGKTRLSEIAIRRVGKVVDVLRQDGGSLYVPEGETYVVPSGTTARFTDVTVDGELDVQGDLVIDDKSSLQNKYGKIEDPEHSFIEVGTAVVYRYYRFDDDSPREGTTPGGRVDQEEPRLIAPSDTPIQEEDRVVYSSNATYQVMQRTSRQTYAEFRTQLVTG